LTECGADLRVIYVFVEEMGKVTMNIPVKQGTQGTALPTERFENVKVGGGLFRWTATKRCHFPGV
jgi:hypothetical protein